MRGKIAAISVGVVIVAIIAIGVCTGERPPERHETVYLPTPTPAPEFVHLDDMYGWSMRMVNDPDLHTHGTFGEILCDSVRSNIDRYDPNLDSYAQANPENVEVQNKVEDIRLSLSVMMASCIRGGNWR